MKSFISNQTKEAK